MAASAPDPTPFEHQSIETESASFVMILTSGAHRTKTVPVMPGWNVHTYAYRPAFVKRSVYRVLG